MAGGAHRTGSCMMRSDQISLIYRIMHEPPHWRRHCTVDAASLGHRRVGVAIRVGVSIRQSASRHQRSAAPRGEPGVSVWLWLFLCACDGRCRVALISR